MSVNMQKVKIKKLKDHVQRSIVHKIQCYHCGKTIMMTNETADDVAKKAFEQDFEVNFRGQVACQVCVVI